VNQSWTGKKEKDTRAKMIEVLLDALARNSQRQTPPVCAAKSYWKLSQASALLEEAEKSSLPIVLEPGKTVSNGEATAPVVGTGYQLTSTVNG
jgi:hypothetical protein